MEWILAFMAWVVIQISFIIIGNAIDKLNSKLASLGNEQAQADEGLVFWKLGDNYVWTSPEDFVRLRLTDRSE